MSEFVEASLERLIPVFELLQTIGLFSKIEVKRFVKRCRNFEYRLQKTVSLIAMNVILSFCFDLFLKLTFSVKIRMISYFMQIIYTAL